MILQCARVRLAKRVERVATSITSLPFQPLKVAHEPVGGEALPLRPSLLEEVGRSRTISSRFSTCSRSSGPPRSSRLQARRFPQRSAALAPRHARCLPGEIRTSAARDDCAYLIRALQLRRLGRPLRRCSRRKSRSSSSWCRVHPLASWLLQLTSRPAGRCRSAGGACGGPPLPPRR